MMSSVHFLMERAIDTPVKLHCVMLFAERTLPFGTAAQVAARVGHDIWTTKQALEELKEAGILRVANTDGEPTYEYCPVRYFEEVLRLLVAAYNDPLQRNELQDYVRELARYAPYRADFGRMVPV